MIAVALLSALLQTQTAPRVEHLEQTPVFRAEVVAKTAKAINYRHRSGATTIDFKGTSILPKARGEAKVESKQGYIEIEVEFDNLDPASKHGNEYLTYVLWAVTPEGRPSNLGEILLNGTKSKLNVTTELQVFGLVVTAEPYFAVTQPSDVIVLENMVRKDTLGKIEEVDAKYELLQRGQYANLIGKEPLLVNALNPLELYEARRAIEIARSSGAAKYATETFDKSVKSLAQAEAYVARKAGRRPVAMMAREAVQTAEDSRAIAVKRIQEENLARERQEAADREARANAEAQAQTQRRTLAEAERKAEAERRARAEAEKELADSKRLIAELAAAQAARQQAEAEAAKTRALLEEQAAKAAAEQSRLEAERSRQLAEEAQRLREQAEKDRHDLRAKLLNQFNMILDTRDTDRGLVVNMGDVLFDIAKYTLRPVAREKLARLAGIVISHPGLRLESEGHTDSIGSDEYNQKLSEQRAEAVRAYLIEQGVPEPAISSLGFGKTIPVAPNETAKGRQQNRRVEIVISGEVIGAKIGASRL
jgi:outer membrane protein OmpA-like peptidoglycan-associated protein